MNVETERSIRPDFRFRLIPSVMLLALLVLVGCSPASPQASAQPTPGAVDTQPTPTTAAASPSSEVEIPTGWSTYTNEGCAYQVSYPPEMQLTPQGPYSLTLGYQPGQPDDPVPYFIYLSVVDPQIKELVAAGSYEYEVYNYDPAEAETLLGLPVGGSAALRESTDAAAGFSYQRLPDRMVSGYTAQAYENQQPWGFPGGTEEIRYLLPVGECTYLIGAYVDGGQSNLPGAFGPELFQQIAESIQVGP